MSVQKVAARPSSMWKPISIGDSDVETRMRAGRLASREYASAVLFMLVRGSQLPAELVDRSFSWLRVVDQEFCRGEGLIRKLGTDIGLKRDPVGEALRSMEQVIDESASKFEVANNERPQLTSMAWPLIHSRVKEIFDNANRQACSRLPRRLQQQIGDLISDLEDDMCGADWQACHETVAVLGCIVSRELLASPNTHPLGQREFPEIRSRGNTVRALVSLGELTGHDARLVELVSTGTIAGLDARLKTVVGLLEEEAPKASADLTKAMNESISMWIGGLKSAWKDNHERRYCENFTALRQALSAWIRNERRGRLGPVEPL